MRVARNIGLIGLAVVMVACSDATQPTSTEPAPYEGAKVSMTGTSTISIPGLNGQLVSATTREWATDAIVTNGLAEAAQSRILNDPNAAKMPVLYVSDTHVSARGPRNTRQIVSWKDSKGSAGDFVFVTGDAGPVKTMVHVGADRHVDQAYSFEWKKVRGGWLATAFTASLFKNGKAVGQIRSATKAAPRGPSKMVAEPDDACWTDPLCDPGSVVPSGIPGGTWGGAYYGSGCCANELNLYLIAAAGFAGAWQICSDTGTLLTAGCILTLTSLGATAAMLLYAYHVCWRNSRCAGQPPLASIGGTPPPDSFWLPKQYFRTSVVPAWA